MKNETPEIGYYDKLSNYLSDELGAIALQGQMGDIVDIVRRMDGTTELMHRVAVLEAEKRELLEEIEGLKNTIDAGP